VEDFSLECPPRPDDDSVDGSTAAAKPKKPRRPPKTAVGTFLEYLTPDGKPWRCDAPDKLFTDFGITGNEDESHDALTRFHGDVAPAKESWDVIRRLYRLAPVIGAKPDDLREWSVEEIAKEANVPKQRVEMVVEETKVFWARRNNERELVSKAVESSPAAIGDLDEDQIEKLLSRHGFEDLPKEHRRHMARRILEFQHLLEDEQGAYLARSALMQELILLSYDSDIRHEMAKDRVSRGNEALDKLVTKRNALQSQYESTLEKLGATQEQNPGHRAKVAFGDSLGFMAKAMQAYYADDNNALVDGLFTAAEIKLLVTPTALRPSQYRPDLALLAAQWQEHFWEQKWEGVKLPREMFRFLQQSFQKASQQFAEGKTAEMDAEEVVEGDAELAVESATLSEAGADLESMVLPAPNVMIPRTARGGEDVAWVS